MKLINKNIYPLPGVKDWFHLATIHHGVREFVCIFDSLTQKAYIEEITGGHLEFILDDNLALALSQFCDRYKVKDLNRILPLMKGVTITERPR